MQEYGLEDLKIIVESVTRRGYRFMSEDGWPVPAKGSHAWGPGHMKRSSRGARRVRATNIILNWLKKLEKDESRRPLTIAMLNEIAPTEYPPEDDKEYATYEAYRGEFIDFKNVLFEIPIENIPALISDDSIREYVDARLTIGS